MRNCALLASMLLLAGCGGGKQPVAEVVRPVKTMVVVAGEEPQERIFPGKAEASRAAELAFQVPGVIVKLPVKEGQEVKKGELIAQLREDEFRARLTALQGQLDGARADLRRLQAGERPEERLRREAAVRAAQATLANTKSELDRNSRLVENRIISRQDFELSEKAYLVALENYQQAVQVLEKGAIAREEDIEAQQAAVRALEGRVVEASIQLADCTLEAPYDGVIAQVFVDERQNVQAKQAIVRFQDVQEIDIVVDVPEAVLGGAVRRSEIVEINAEFNAAPGLRFPVQLREVAQKADPVTQTFAVRVGLPAPKDVNILPGMTSTVTLRYRRAAVLGSRILVPSSAVVQSGEGQSAVWLVGGDGKVTRRAVKLAAASGGDIEITDGLAPGDRIATAGANSLRDGMTVRDLGDALSSSR